MTNLYAVENIDIDLNSLFNLTYNFDLLKKTLEAILTNQKNNSQHIKDLQEKLEEKDKKIEEIEDKLKKKDDYDGKLSVRLNSDF
jgi:chromosome segregation ATPase